MKQMLDSGKYADSQIHLFLQKHQEFDEAYNAMKRLLNYYKELTFTMKVYDMDIYLQSFKSYLFKANRA